jgi:hypothetical protein
LATSAGVGAASRCGIGGLCSERWFQIGGFGNDGFGVWVMAGLHSSNLYVAISRYSHVGVRLPFVCAVAFCLDIEIEFLVLYFNMTALWTAHLDCPEHVKIELKTRVQSFPPSFPLAPVNDKVFEKADVRQERLLRMGSVAGFRRRSDK